MKALHERTRKLRVSMRGFAARIAGIFEQDPCVRIRARAPRSQRTARGPARRGVVLADISAIPRRDFA